MTDFFIYPITKPGVALPYERYPYLSVGKTLELKQKRFIALCVSVSSALLVSALHKDSQFIVNIEDKGALEKSEQSVKNLKNNKKYVVNHFDFLQLLKKTEGFSSQFYHDNRGIAAAYGWNITKNSPDFNRQVAMAAGLPSKEIKTIVAYSKKEVNTIPVALARIEIDEKKANKSVDFLYDFYFQEFKNVFKQKIQSSQKEKILARLNTHFTKKQRAVFAHMAYKVGKNGLSQYENFFTVLESTLSKPKLESSDLRALQKEIVYSYQSREGEKRYDEKVQALHRAEFETQTKAFRVAENQENTLKTKM